MICVVIFILIFKLFSFIYLYFFDDLDQLI